MQISVSVCTSLCREQASASHDLEIELMKLLPGGTTNVFFNIQITSSTLTNIIIEIQCQLVLANL
jgi:hypothetical protein